MPDLILFPGLGRRWWILLVRGIVAIIFGLLAFAWPGLTIIILTTLFAAYALVDGIFALIIGVHARWWLLALLGVLGILAGLFAFFYVCLHFLTYLGPDQSFDLAGMWKDVAKRPFITVGFLGFVLLIPLALTSTTGWIRRLGGKRWQMLHRAIYISAIAGVVHYYWLVKSDVRKPLFYGALVAILLLWRLGSWISRRRSQAPVRVAAPGVSVSG